MAPVKKWVKKMRANNDDADMLTYIKKDPDK